MSESVRCTCAEFIAATKDGTDHEGYGAAITFFQNQWSIGLDAPRLLFCPYCGKPVRFTQPESHE